MAQNWQADFEALTKRERTAFRWLEKTLHKINDNPGQGVIQEMEQAFTVWQAATKAISEFALGLHAQQMKLSPD
jgi:hypothetical protein